MLSGYVDGLLAAWREIPASEAEGALTTRRLKVWIDLENSPHVLFFGPVIDQLRQRGHDVVVTARRFCDTLALAHARGLAVRAIGSGHDTGRNQTIKRLLHVVRCTQLARFARAHRFDVAASHASRTQASTAARLGIFSWAAVDYEHSYLWDLRTVRCLMVPGIIPVGAFDRNGIPRAVIQTYDGLKEDVYLHGFQPRTDSRCLLNVSDDEILIVHRPSSDNANYGEDASRVLEHRLLRRLAQQEGVRIIVLPRTAHQRRKWRMLERGNRKLHVHDGPLDGPSLILSADLVVSGGGTMAREAAVLGVPAIVCGTHPLGAVDEFLIRHGQIAPIRTVAEVDRVGPVQRAPRRPPRVNGAPLQQVVDAICATAGNARDE